MHINDLRIASTLSRHRVAGESIDKKKSARKIRKNKNILGALIKPRQTYYNCTKAVLICYRKKTDGRFLAKASSVSKKRSLKVISLQVSPEKCSIASRPCQASSLQLTILLCEQKDGRIKQQKKICGERKTKVLRPYRATGPRIRALSLVRGESTTALQSHVAKNPSS